MAPFVVDWCSFARHTSLNRDAQNKTEAGSWGEHVTLPQHICELCGILTPSRSRQDVRPVSVTAKFVVFEASTKQFEISCGSIAIELRFLSVFSRLINTEFFLQRLK